MSHSTARRRALCSVHDVRPGCLSLVSDILADLEDRGVTAVGLAVVPRFHGGEDWEGAAAFRDDLAARAVRTEVMLHGFFHARVGGNENLPWPRRALSGLLSAGEDEFFGLGRREAEERLLAGAEILERAFGGRPRAFVPPAWAGGRNLRTVLRRLGFRVTEDHLWLYDIERRRKVLSPVVAFATRTPRRERLSLAWARTVRRAGFPGRILRFVLHPSDYSSPATREFALGLAAGLSENYDWILPSEFPGSRKERS